MNIDRELGVEALKKRKKYLLSDCIDLNNIITNFNNSIHRKEEQLKELDDEYNILKASKNIFRAIKMRSNRKAYNELVVSKKSDESYRDELTVLLAARKEQLEAVNSQLNAIEQKDKFFKDINIKGSKKDEEPKQFGE